ncbi:MAG: hypothetical protein SFU85_12520 [Candidatus Methylacidiphilales bacterium]|nr:hypothetical protein [Candidatus Methylacidiphilales bacterium]
MKYIRLCTILKFLPIILLGFFLLPLVPSRAAVDLNTILPNDFDPSLLQEHFQNDHYGFLLDKRGCLRSIHNAGGVVLFRKVGEWIIQGTPKEGPDKFTYDGGIPTGPELTVVKTKDEAGNPVFNYVNANMSNFVLWGLKVTCLPTKIVLEYNMKITQDLPHGVDTNFILPIDTNKEMMEDGFNAEPGNPLVFNFKSGTATVAFDQKFVWYGTPGYNASAGGATFYLDFGGTKTVGGSETLRFEIEVP